MALSPSSLPFLGAGLGYRRAIRPFFRKYAERLGFLEVMPEHVLQAAAPARDALDEDCRKFPVVTHSVSLSLGTATGADLSFARKARVVSRRYKAAWTSDHCCFTKIGNQNIGQLTPIPYTEEALEVMVRNVRAVQRIAGIPFLVENISQYFQFKHADMQEPEFLSELARRSGCGMLLDVTNLRNNAANLGVKPARYLDRYPLERLVQFHLAGSEWIDGHLLDTHGAPIVDEVWKMTEQVIGTSNVRALLIERDQTFGPLGRLASELKRANTLMSAAAGA